jgi:hypothetical protein
MLDGQGKVPAIIINQEVSKMMLLKPNCECCDRDLPPDSPDARICTFECTFCEACATKVFGGACPNCKGNFAPRPIRPEAMRVKYPASSIRHLRAQPCA